MCVFNKATCAIHTGDMDKRRSFATFFFSIIRVTLKTREEGKRVAYALL